jgi:hypothetical protein
MEEVVMDDVAKLKAELAELNLRCQQARDNEVRYGLQRSRLEAERAQLLARMIEATQQPALSAPYAVTWQSAALANKTVAKPAPRLTVVARNVRNPKPRELPPMSAMVLSVLDGAKAAGLRPRQIRDRIREKYWPEAPADRVFSVVWRLAKGGKLSRSDGHYRLRQCNGGNLNGH